MEVMVKISIKASNLELGDHISMQWTHWATEGQMARNSNAWSHKPFIQNLRIAY